MKKLLVFNKIITCCLFTTFLWQSIVATLKLLDRKTSIFSDNVDGLSILFPSITICKKHLNGIHPDDIQNKSLSVQNKISILHENTWRRNESIYFFSHSKMFNLSFPCNTIEGATDGGKPCSFPYVEPYNSGLQKSCSKRLNYCYTRFVKISFNYLCTTIEATTRFSSKCSMLVTNNIIT